MRILACVLGVCALLPLAGCAARVGHDLSGNATAISDTSSGISGSASDAAAPTVVPVADEPVPYVGEPPVASAPVAPAPQPRYTVRKAGGSCCERPCERGCASWHVRGVGGVTFPIGEDLEGDPQGYYGADIGWTSACCWGIDAFYRGHCGKFDRNVPVPGATVFQGEDGGRWHHVGLKFTYEGAICEGSCWSWYAGLGGQFYWTDDYLVDDDGFGLFGELGVTYSINRNWRIRAGVEVLGQNTQAGHTTPALDGESRFVWFVSPVLQVQIDF